MFWSKPKLTLKPDEGRWIEESLLWLLKQFGNDYFLTREVILPVAKSFPDKYRPTEECALVVARRVCWYMDVDPDSVDFFFIDDWEDNKGVLLRTEKADSGKGVSGLYFGSKDGVARQKIAVHCKNLKNPFSLVATISHEVGHVILLGGGRMSREDQSHERMTDLLTVFLGMGIFTANAAFQFHQWRTAGVQGWRASRLGYLSEEAFGYALACTCFLRGDKKAGWSDMLAMNVRHYFKAGLLHLNNGGGTLLKPLR